MRGKGSKFYVAALASALVASAFIGTASATVIDFESAPLKGVELIFKIHLFFGMTVFLLFPFTRLVHVWSVPLTYLGCAYQIVRVKRVPMN